MEFKLAQIMQQYAGGGEGGVGAPSSAELCAFRLLSPDLLLKQISWYKDLKFGNQNQELRECRFIFTLKSL